MKKFLALGAALLAVSACTGGGGGAGNETKEGGNAAAPSEGASGSATSASTGGAAGNAGGGNDSLQPGLYEMTMQMNMNVPGMPQASQNQPPQTRRECITPEETREMAETMGEEPEGMQCSERQFTMRGGTMSGRMNCRGQGGELRIQLSGEYTSTSFNFRQEMAGRMPGADQPMNMRLQAQGRRVGECPAGEEGEDRGGSGNSAAGE